MRPIAKILALACGGALLLAACVDGTTPDCDSGCEPSEGEGGTLPDAGADSSTDTGLRDTSVQDQTAPDAADARVADAPPG
jgi:hypothetical protein